MINEIWKDIPDHPGYQASNTGYIRSSDGKPLPACMSPRHGQLMVNLDGVDYSVSHLVNITFGHPRFGQFHRFFKDGNRYNCAYDNLVYRPLSGVMRPVLEIDSNGTILREYESIRLASRIQTLPYQGILKCCQGRQQTCGGSVWTYSESLRVSKVSPEPLTCPCCGSHARIVVGNKFRIECCTCGLTTRRFDDAESALNSWNKRPV